MPEANPQTNTKVYIIKQDASGQTNENNNLEHLPQQEEEENGLDVKEVEQQLNEQEPKTEENNPQGEDK